MPISPMSPGGSLLSAMTKPIMAYLVARNIKRTIELIEKTGEQIVDSIKK